MKTDNIISFAVGAAAGVSIAFFILDKKYRKMYEEDVASVKEAFSKKQEKTDEFNHIKSKPVRKEDFNNVIDYARAMKHYDPDDDSDYGDNDDNLNVVEPDEEDTENDMTVEEIERPPHKEGYVPSIVSSTAFADEDYPYDTNTFIMFADGVITDDDYVPLEEDEIEGTIGMDAINHFGEDPEDPDVVYVRNDEKQSYYEIVRDARESTEMRP